MTSISAAGAGLGPRQEDTEPQLLAFMMPRQTTGEHERHGTGETVTGVFSTEPQCDAAENLAGTIVAALRSDATASTGDLSGSTAQDVQRLCHALRVLLEHLEFDDGTAGSLRPLDRARELAHQIMVAE